MAASIVKLRSCVKIKLGVLVQPVRGNSNASSITRTHRFAYARTYPTLLVFPDGSTINIRYKEPRSIIKLPVDISAMSEEEKKQIATMRKPKQTMAVIEDFDTTVNLNEYSKFFKK